MSHILKKYAELLVNYSLEVQEGERVYIQTTTLAEPLLREVYRSVLKAGGLPHVNLEFQGKSRIFMDTANEAQLSYNSPLYKEAMTNFECYLFIRAPFNTSEMRGIDGAKSSIIAKGKQKYRDIYSQRTAVRELKRSLCEFPTQAMAQNAGMSFENYQNFSPSYRKGYLSWLYQAKREATKEKRILEIIKLLS